MDAAAVLASVRRLAQRLTDARDSRAVQSALADELLEALPADQVHVHVPSGDGMQALAYLPGQQPESYRLPCSGLPSGVEWVAQTGLPLVVPASQTEATIPAHLSGPWRVASAVFVPLIVGRDVRAVVGAARTREGEFGRSDLELAEVLATQASAALGAADAWAAADADALTGCLNHGALLRRLAEEVARSQRSRTPLACLIIDLDDFKEINDRYGHLTGDDVLRHVGETLRVEFRLGDPVARYGGDEFVVLLPGAERPRAEAAGRRALERVHDIRVLIGTDAQPVGASLGVAALNAPRTGEELLGAADAALRRGKLEGKDRLAVWDPHTETTG